MSRSSIPILLVAVGVLGLVVAASAATGYSVTASDTTTIPERTVTVEGSEFTVGDIAVRDRGEPLEVTTTAPEQDRTYELNFYNAHNEIVDSRRLTGDGEATFGTDCSRCDPGSYVVVITDEDYEAVQPVLIAGYDVSLDVPSHAEQGESVTATVDVSATAASGAPHRVEVGFGDAGDEYRYPATHEGDGRYAVELSLDVVPRGEYTIYAVALGEETFEDTDEHQMVGMSQGATFTVGDSDEPTTNPNDGGGDTEPGDGTETPGTPTSTPIGTTPTATEDASPDGTPTATTTATATDADGVITPRRETTETDADGGGFGIAFAVAALLVAVMGRRR